VFDTGLQRQLTLSHSDSTNRNQIRGPQPETIKDYQLEVCHGESTRAVIRVSGNYQRKRVHLIEPSTVDALNFQALATQGSGEARLFEIRVYG